MPVLSDMNITPKTSKPAGSESLFITAKRSFIPYTRGTWETKLLGGLTGLITIGYKQRHASTRRD